MATMATKDCWGWLSDLAATGVFPKTVHRIGLWGPPGTGKSSWARQHFSNVVTVKCHPDMSASDLVGGMGLVEGKRGGSITKCVPQFASAAMRDGHVLVLDEVDKHSPDVGTALYGICDDLAIAQVNLPDGQVIRPAPGFGVIGTMNATPEALPAALRDRFLWIYVDRPAPGIFASLPNSLAEVLRSAPITEQRWITPVSVRSVLLLKNLVGQFGRDALALVFGERARDVEDIIDAHGGL